MTDSARFKLGMRRLASGVSLITTIDGADRHGFVATAVSSVAAEPVPTLLICVNGLVSSHDVIERSGVFCVNLLGAGDSLVARQFSSAHLRHERFSAGDWRTLGSGAPALASALASFDCRVVSKLKVHTHTIFVAEVHDILLTAEPDGPLLYADGRFANLQPAAAPA